MADDHGMDIAELRELVNQLTPRKAEILPLLAEDLAYYQLGRRLGVREETVHSHVSRIYLRLGIHSRQAAVTLYWRWKYAEEG